MNFRIGTMTTLSAAMPRDNRSEGDRRDMIRLQILWLTCAAIGFAITAAVSCALALASSLVVSAV